MMSINVFKKHPGKKKFQRFCICGGNVGRVQMTEISHENLNKFVGLCIVSFEVTIVTAYCSRNSLQVVPMCWLIDYYNYN